MHVLGCPRLTLLLTLGSEFRKLLVTDEQLFSINTALSGSLNSKKKKKKVDHFFLPFSFRRLMSLENEQILKFITFLSGLVLFASV